jgi:hypothetical protein
MVIEKGMHGNTSGINGSHAGRSYYGHLLTAFFFQTTEKSGFTGSGFSCYKKPNVPLFAQNKRQSCKRCCILHVFTFL